MCTLTGKEAALLKKKGEAALWGVMTRTRVTNYPSEERDSGRVRKGPISGVFADQTVPKKKPSRHAAVEKKLKHVPKRESLTD